MVLRIEPKLSEAKRWSIVGLSVSAVVAGLSGAPGLAQATPVFTLPTGLNPGDHYRLIFTSLDGIAATSTDIATYNAFANAEAALNSLLPTTTWTALVSTRAVNAVDNVACAGACGAAAIYDVLGNQIVASTTALFSGAATTLNADQNGDPNSSYNWSGSFPDGTVESWDGGALGEENPGQGTPVWGGYYLVGWGATSGGNDGLFPIVAMSGDLIFDAPEPASAAVLAASAAVLALARRRRRARAD